MLDFPHRILICFGIFPTVFWSVSRFPHRILMYPRLAGGCEISLTQRRSDRHKNRAACHKHFPHVSKLSFHKMISSHRVVSNSLFTTLDIFNDLKFPGSGNTEKCYSWPPCWRFSVEEEMFECSLWEKSLVWNDHLFHWLRCWALSLESILYYTTYFLLDLHNIYNQVSNHQDKTANF